METLETKVIIENSDTAVEELFRLFDEQTVYTALIYSELYNKYCNDPNFINGFSSDARRLATILMNRNATQGVEDITERAKKALAQLDSLKNAARGKMAAEGQFQDFQGDLQAPQALQPLIEEISAFLRDAMITIAAWRYYGAEIPEAVQEEARKISVWLEGLDANQAN